MKTLKITEEAWKKLSLFKTYNNKKTFSDAIETAIFYANTAHLPLGNFKIKKDAIYESTKFINIIKEHFGVKEDEKK